MSQLPEPGGCSLLSAIRALLADLDNVIGGLIKIVHDDEGRPTEISFDVDGLRERLERAVALHGHAPTLNPPESNKGGE